ncbi:MAG: hypothetical protein LBQ54_13655, partial [Planctomycetaceae bacterium]|nr:hypothetical protein [Planctomycetaceae bacterium]
MAKAKASFIDNVKKYHFWILCPTAIVLALVIFYLANNAKIKAYNDRKNALDTLKKNVSTISSDAQHPNPPIIENINAETDILRNDVYNAWVRMYRDQKEKNLWPSSLQREFLDLVATKKKFDNIELPAYREFYHLFIVKHLPELLRMAERREVKIRRIDPKTQQPEVDENGNDKWTPIDPFMENPEGMLQTGTGLSGGSGTGGGVKGGGGIPGGMGGRSGGGMGDGMSSDIYSGGGAMGGINSDVGAAMEEIRKSRDKKTFGVVDWPDPEVFGLVTWVQFPSSFEIWVTQEDLWVYEALIRVIRNSNQAVGATDNNTAAVKRIQSMLIGRNAA